ncbi:MAG TPA: patatin-like phospholipase family protein, partial [Solirubrobacteraceae bacterium]
MGKVVKLEAQGKGRGKPASARARTRRRARSKTALVLGGGGFTGGVYEIGALRALDLLSVNRTVNEFDVYVGTSAGSFVAALTANGITPEEMMRVVNRQGPTPFRDVDLDQLLRPNWGEFVTSAAKLPFRTLGLARTLIGAVGPRFSAMDILTSLAEILPSGAYSGAGIERYVRTVLSDPDRADDFRLLENELYLTATDLDTCERVVFGAADWDDVPISSAVRASTALPMVYKPVEIKDRELVDGGIVSTTNIDIAVEAGAKFVIVVNPLVPYVNDFSKKVSTLTGSRTRRVSDMGFPQIGYQTFKLLAYQRLHEVARQWEQRYPGVDIVLIEPEPNDELMFTTSIMNFAARVDIARHGFQSVTLKLAQDYDHFKEVCDRHGIEISATRVRKVVKHFAAEKERTRA